MKIRRFIVVSLAALSLPLFFIPLTAQTLTRPDLTAIIAGAARQRTVYINEFKDLLAQETKSFEIYNKKGGIKKSRVIISTFIVYQVAGDDRNISEFRNILSVDGKKIDNSEKRAQEFFEEIARAESSGRELQKLEREGSRYDEELSLNGLTLFQAVVLADNLWPYFEFKLEGVESVDGRQVYVISYAQTKDSPYVLIDPKRHLFDGKPTLVYDIGLDERNISARLQGRFWIDAEAFQVRKERRVLNVSRDGSSTVVVAADTTLEYQNSAFNILTPRTLTFIQYSVVNKGQESRKDVAITFEYSNFTKPDVEVKSADIKN